MFKENPTEKLVEYILSLPANDQELIAKSISKNKVNRLQKKSASKGKMTKTREEKLNRIRKKLSEHIKEKKETTAYFKNGGTVEN